MSANVFAAPKQAWADIAAHAAQLANATLTDLLSDPDRVASLTYAAPHLTADFSKQRIDTTALALLDKFAAAAEFDAWRGKLFAGEVVNNTEGRAAMHWKLRITDPPGGDNEVTAVLDRMHDFAHEIAEGGKFDAVVHLGIGGSDLGPRLVLDAVKAERRSNIEVRFAANVDGADVADAIEGLDPKRTLLIVVSKTFTTQETLANAEFVRAWGPARIAAATAAPEKAVAWGVAESDVFPFWDWVGGRYSLWSSVSLVCEIALKHGVFFRMLEGAEEMDAHFRDAPFAQNLPAISAAVQMWNREALGHGSYAVIPYAERLRLLPAWLQQLEMESNGKRVTRDGEPLTRSACAVTWGAAGTNAQHSFFQLLHQGVEEIPVEFIVNAGPQEGPPAHRAKVYANALAQARALMVGKSQQQVLSEMKAKGVANAEALAPHRTFPGNRASTMMAIDALSPEAVGALLAFYEHRTFTQAVLACVNPFDQWGVELGKEMANALLPALEGGTAPADVDASTAFWLDRLK
ncbi:MAG TPA: glucose-6-phosphate isomerase [Vitreimonas sp.]|uniref:glucose-6-phosphate isomerase n=1 Tax=Vitreimonas sp. TaxID=3069702 RepID=UPI002D6C756D|nr:glucose-6-phosphate isomerase [Vitreimonas sp.]HYD87569.1 glucose-6-phosphate isomerase [Vitreimonas sp.]